MPNSNIMTQTSFRIKDILDFFYISFDNVVRKNIIANKKHSH